MNIFSYIKNHVSIYDLASEYATLKKAGSYFKGRCPFHHEKTASFTVSPDKGIFYCFGCHAGGDVITFMSKIENCSQIEAANLLAERFNIDIPKEIAQNHSESHVADKQHYNEVCKQAALWCNEQLKKNPNARKYLLDRDISEKAIDYFSIGYFPGGLGVIRQFIQYMQKHNILVKDLSEANILSEGKTVMYSPYEERIIFPIKDNLGRFCGFGGRIFKPHDERPKYYNSRENEYFTKGSLLFGFDLARKTIQKTGTVFLVEGYTDCVAMVQHGYPNTVATLGTACTLQHLKLLSRYANQLYVVFDNDKAGQQAILRLTELCWQVNLELNVIQLPQEEDPASYLHNHKDLTTLLNTSQDIFSFFIATVGKNFTPKSLGEKVAITRSLLQTVQRVEDPLKRDILLQKASTALNVPLTTLKEELNRLPQDGDKTEQAKPLEQEESGEKALPKLEKLIFCAIINNVQLFNKINEQYIIEYLPSPLNQVLNHLKNIIAEIGSADLTFSQLFEKLSDTHKSYVSKLLLEQSGDISESAFEQLLIRLQKKRWKIIVQDIKLKLTRAKKAGDTQTINKLLQDFTHLKQKIMPELARDM